MQVGHGEALIDPSKTDGGAHAALARASKAAPAQDRVGKEIGLTRRWPR
jgi:hypothetical protein